MLTIFLALGIIAAAPSGSSDVVTPAERVIELSRTNGFTAASHSVDPTDELDFVVDLTELLEVGEAFSSVAIAVTPTSTALGFTIPGSGEYAPETVTNSTIRIWPRVALVDQADASWAGSGATCRFEITAETDSVPPRTWQRTAQITVMQK